MANKTLKKTTLTDALVKQAGSQAYEAGMVDKIASQVSKQFPDVEAPAVRALVFSRRAVILGAGGRLRKAMKSLSQRKAFIPTRKLGKAPKLVAVPITAVSASYRKSHHLMA